MNVLLVLFALGGLAVSSYIYSKKRRHERLVCLMHKNCDTVVHSRYSALLFGIPNEVLGMIYFGLVAVVAVTVLLGFSSIGIFQLVPALVVIGGVAAGFSVVLIFIQAKILREWCDYCLISAAASIIIFLVELASV
ncbi:MAG: vitamin K epoxide reductase family protein [Patescibacteria group bacterium]